MKKNYSLLVILVLAGLVSANAQSKFWSPVDEATTKISGERVIVPKAYKAYQLVNGNLKTVLWSAPNEKNVTVQNSTVIVELPMPDGSLQKFKVVESPVMAPELAAQFPDIKTFSIAGMDDSTATGKLDFTEMGFHGMISRAAGDVYIDPYSRPASSFYISYNKADFEKAPDKKIEELPVQDVQKKSEKDGDGVSTGTNESMAPCVGATLRTYRLAVACTGEYAKAATGSATPTVSQALSCIVTTVNRVGGVYERDLAIKMVLVAAETTIVYTDPATDPFTGNNNASTLMNESQTVIDQNIGNTNYDVGHTFSTGGGGVSTLAGICVTGRKAKSITGSPQPVGDPYDIDYVAHEMGHDFGGNHTFRAVSGSCSGNENPGTMVEPGSGITIMAYAGICSGNNDSTHSIAYFHGISYDEIVTYTNSSTGNNCPVKTATSNSPPTVTGAGNYAIPKSTPFILTGSATDPDGDPLTYSWEEVDNNSTGGNWNDGNKPYFRPHNPSSSPSRMFPKRSVVLSGTYTTTIGEFLPGTAQTLKFRLTARDNKVGGGGVCSALSTVTVTSSGPLSITAPNTTGITWASTSSQTITWSVNGTDVAPVNCPTVNILISYDGGLTFSMLMASVANSGSQLITAPTLTATITTCRIKVESIGNIFFDINDKNFTITAGATGIVSPYSAVNTLGMQVVPNPAADHIQVNLSGLDRNAQNTLKIYDVMGNVMMRDVFSGKEDFELMYNLSGLSKGLYIIEVTGEGKQSFGRIVKQ